ncbi:MAG: peptide ABC transporter substrate-binding protein [Dehalococcoidia bacterium]|nr:peptide ABC transporter substrate-binding protein [Dehalococcoidia bacterium]
MSPNRLLAILLGVVAALVLVIGGFSVVLLLSGRGGDEGSPSGVTTGTGAGGSKSGAGAVLRLPGADPITLDPALAGDSTSAEYIVELFSGLVTIDQKLSLQLDLAESYEVSADGLTFTFKLRDNAVFQSGRRVTASDVQWSIDRAASPVPVGATQPSTTALAYLGDIDGVRERFFGQAPSVRGLQVVDERTIRIRLKEALPPPLFLAKLSYPTAFVVDRQQLESNPRNWTRKPNGTGPYQLKEWRLGERIVLQANQRFYRGAPPLPQVLYDLQGGSALTRFENNELDVAAIGLADIERARDPSNVLSKLYQQAPQFTIFYIAFNTKVPPFDDVNVRRALAQAIDRKKVATVTFNNMWLPATGVLPPQLPGFTAEDKSLPFDPAAARASLKASKYGSADKLPPIILTEVGGGAEAGIDTQAFLEQWKTELGLRVEIRQTDFATFLADQDSGRLQMFNAGWIMDYPDAEDVIDLKFHSASSLNDLGYSNAQVDKLLDAARVNKDPVQRVQQYQQAERLIIADVAWIPLYFAQSHVVVNKDVQGWFVPPMVIPRLRFVRLNR